jgi:two-component system chemotaxis response regulator CheY
MKKKILVLDDSPFMLTIIGDMLKKLDYDVTTSDNGDDACQKIESKRFDMIITDMNMPVMDGLEFTSKVRTYPGCRFVPIIMLSSEGDEEKISKAKKMGVSTFISKPLNEGQLKSMLQIILSKRKSPRIPAKLEVFYGENNMPSGYTIGCTENLSVGGVFIETNNPLSLGVKLKLKLSLPDQECQMFCQGRVAWVSSPFPTDNIAHPPGMGVEFLDLEDKHQLQDFLRSGVWKR